jgi:hypothetical protein
MSWLSEPTAMGKALNGACLEATVIVCAWLGFCVVTSAPYPSWSAIGFFAVGWLAVTAIRHGIVSRKRW